MANSKLQMAAVSFLRSAMLSDVCSVAPTTINGKANPKRLSSPMVLSFPRKTVYILTPMVIPTQCLVAATGALPVSVTSSMESAICSLHSICKF